MTGRIDVRLSRDALRRAMVAKLRSAIVERVASRWDDGADRVVDDENLTGGRAVDRLSRDA